MSDGPDYGYGERDEFGDAIECLDGPDDCAGAVEWRSTPDRPDFKVFARCEHHFDLRLASAGRNLELLSPEPPAWFDPSYAGERWDED